MRYGIQLREICCCKFEVRGCRLVRMPLLLPDLFQHVYTVHMLTHPCVFDP